MKIVTSTQMRQIETRSERAGVSQNVLMEHAGLAVARRVRHHLGPLTGVPVVVLVGPGNNGRDGLVTAHHLHKWGARVVPYICHERLDPDPKLETLRDQGLNILKASLDESLFQLRESLASAHIVIDAVLGTGFLRTIDGTLKEIFIALTEAKSKRGSLRILAMDLPSGLNANNGSLDPSTPTADFTVALGYPKRGHYTLPGASKVGILEIEDIGIPSGLDYKVDLELMTPMWANTMLPHRPLSAHKGTFGKTMLVCGSREYTGAAYLAATSATRVGSGLVTVAAPYNIQVCISAKAPEPTYLPLPESLSGSESIESVALISEHLAGYQALLIGCGLGQAIETKNLVVGLLCSNISLPPTVVDADGLNSLAGLDSWWKDFGERAIVTPHVGEMSRLTKDSIETIQKDRLNIAIKSAMAWNKIVVLKGAYTVVAFPDGRAMISPFANPGLASAGTGDVLSGAIVGLLSQGLRLENAAALGVFLHGRTAEKVQQRLGNAGMIAGDLLPELPLVIKDISYGNASR